ncbi:hypothetical protein [Streptosporangium sp. V21-05]|uniref:hypothetical protein n=1 Tax=Streptosporangium sp. V21-05 TaxID=3446115 RepID=UPI003F52E4CC
MPRPLNMECPVCETRLSLPETGRRPRYCSAVCRQAAYRARRRGIDLADRLAEVRGDLAGDADRVADAVDDLLELVDQEDPAPGWKPLTVALAEAVAARAVELARRAREHARVADELATRCRGSQSPR